MRDLLTDLKLGTLLFYKFQLPKTSPLRFEDYVSPIDRMTKRDLQLFTNSRNAVQTALQSEIIDDILAVSDVSVWEHA
jgi:hypothetical protein